jgi:hypothetical protein
MFVGETLGELKNKWNAYFVLGLELALAVLVAHGAVAIYFELGRLHGDD